MPSVLIADAYKSSLVMTSEVFKDKFPGITVFVAKNAEDCLKLLDSNDFDMIVVDFDLPDADGISLFKILRPRYNGPILLTAYPEKNISQAISSELYAYEDACDWIKKPVRFEDMSKKLEKFLVNKKRIVKRFYAPNLEAVLSCHQDTKLKRKSKIKGNIINISIGGALLKFDNKSNFKVGEAITINCCLKLPEDINKKSAVKNPKKEKEKIKEKQTKIKARVAWFDKTKSCAGVEFEKLSDSHLKNLDNMFRSLDKV